MSDKKIAVVTGASRGIGQAIARRLAKEYFVVGTATTEAGAARIADDIAAHGEGAGMVLNVSEEGAIAEFAKAVTAEHGAPVVLVNNAGITRDNILMRMKDDEWDDVIDTNLSAVFRLTKAFIKGMTKARWGRVINISSVVGSMGNAGQSNYAATKAGLMGFSRSLARELGSRNITVNVVAPGFIDTDMTRELPEAQRDALLSQIPLARLGAPEEIAAVVGFLAGDDGAYVTGETIQVNGGMHMC
jgi:3-oxoacyl-[acyl-carrier protein] reductase